MLLVLHTLLHRQLVTAFILRMSGMSLYPDERDLMLGKQGQELFPEIDIQGRFFVGFDPALFLPAIQPALGDAVHNIFAVGRECDAARLFECGESCDDRRKLHAVVGRIRCAAGKLLFCRTIAQDRPPAARTGIAAARAVGKDFYMFHIVAPL